MKWTACAQISTALRGVTQVIDIGFGDEVLVLSILKIEMWRGAHLPFN